MGEVPVYMMYLVKRQIEALHMSLHLLLSLSTRDTAYSAEYIHEGRRHQL